MNIKNKLRLISGLLCVILFFNTLPVSMVSAADNGGTYALSYQIS